MKRRSLRRSVRFAVLERDGFRCVYCGTEATAFELHVDHIKPVVDGGTDDMSNLVTACQPCNSGKGIRRLPDDPIRAAEIRIAEEYWREHVDPNYQPSIRGSIGELVLEVDFAALMKIMQEVAALGRAPRSALRTLIARAGVVPCDADADWTDVCEIPGIGDA